MQDNPFGSEFTAASILEDLEFFDDWEDRYRYIIDLGRKLDFNALMEGKASIPSAWPMPYRLDGSQRVGMIDVGNQHFVRAHADVDFSELKS